MATGQQRESELESKDATKWIKGSLNHLKRCLKEGRSASDLIKWPEIPNVHSKRDLFIKTIESISEQWDVYWERCTKLRRTDVQKAIIQIEKLTSKSPSENLKRVEYHTGMLKDPVFVKLQNIWEKMSNDVPFMDVKTEEFTKKPEICCLNEWFLAYLQYLETVLNLESNTYFVEDLTPQPPQQTDEKIIQSHREIVVSWQELWSSKLTTEDKETIKYIEAIHQISGIQLEKHRNKKKLNTIAKYFICQKTEKMDKRCGSIRTDLPVDLHMAFKLRIYEKILDVLNDLVNIDTIEPPPVPNGCDENLKKQLYAEFQTTMVALKKKVNKSTENHKENGKCESELEISDLR
ncbi:uncharacterized protein LOC134282398 [Saccostrea cucullata]|uniref:uncharacterized protein LOC134282398 n=1 Tax=Saccostrea cuccullata TaxID=36930 RepID=UPI002ED17FF4